VRLVGALRLGAADVFPAADALPLLAVDLVGLPLLLDEPTRAFLAVVGPRLLEAFLGLAFAAGLVAFFVVFAAGFAAGLVGFAAGFTGALDVFFEAGVTVFLAVVVRLLAVAAVFRERPAAVLGVFLVGREVTAFFSGFLVVLATGIGAAFSFPASLRALGASLTFPDGPFGRAKTPFSAPWVIALLMLFAVVAEMRMPYLSSRNFLIVGRLTPVRASEE